MKFRTKKLDRIPQFLIWLALVAASFVPLAACQAKEPPYRILDSGVWASTSAVIYWIDNERVIFMTVKDNDRLRKGTGPFHLSIWEVGKGIKRYTDDFSAVNVCVSDETIYRTQKDAKGNVQHFYGKLGAEKPIAAPKNGYLDPMNCRLHDVDQLMAERGNRAINFLLDRHGYLYKGALRGQESLINDYVLLYRPGEKKPVTLSLRRSDIHGLYYYKFKDAYYIDGLLRSNAATGKIEVTRWLYPDGRVEEVSIPSGPWVGGTAELFPTRMGIFITLVGYKSPKDPGPGGGYLVQGTKYVKVIDGLISGVAVSPDGCKIAFSHAPYDLADIPSSNDPGRRTLKMINFCPKEKNNG